MDGHLVKLPQQNIQDGTRVLGRVMHNNFKSFIFSHFKVWSYKKMKNKSCMQKDGRFCLGKVDQILHEFLKKNNVMEARSWVF